MNRVVAFEHYFDQGSKLQRWVLDQINFSTEMVIDHMDEEAKKWLRMDSNLGQSETFLMLGNLLHDRGAHLIQDISKLKPNQVRIIRIFFVYIYNYST